MSPPKPAAIGLETSLAIGLAIGLENCLEDGRVPYSVCDAQTRFLP
jgi:hypothetical protein